MRGVCSFGVYYIELLSEMRGEDGREGEGRMKYPWCEKCGRHGVCRMESDMAVVLRKLAEVAHTMEGSRFNIELTCPQYYEKGKLQ